MTDEVCAEILALFSRAYGTTYDRETKRTWRLLLDPLPDEQARDAAVRLCRTSPYPPKPADLFRLVQGTESDAERRLDEEAEVRISWMEQNICDYQMFHGGPVLNAVIRAMNGINAIVAMMDTGGWKFERARARTLYRAFRRRPPSAEEGAPVTPLALAANLAAVPLSVYMERGVSVPMIRAPFADESLPALEAGESS